MTFKMTSIENLPFLSSSSSNLGASKSTFEKLSALGYKCEARLSLLYYKMNQGQHDYMRLHKDLTDVLQQKVTSSKSIQKANLNQVCAFHPDKPGPIRIARSDAFRKRVPNFENVFVRQSVALESSRKVGQGQESRNKGKIH